jgi:pimeloyl-ACP methyl ester carboxylesterase
MTLRENCAELSGRKLFGWVGGEGDPLVILDAGMGDEAASWQPIQARVAEFTSVLSYDRAGLGKSGPAPTPRTSQELVDDLRALLHTGDLQPPYLYVAHSWSGFQARYFANHFPQEIAGMLLVDAVHEDKYARFEQVLAPERAERMWMLLRDPTSNDEQIDRFASIEQVLSSQIPYSFPLLVLTRAPDSDPLSEIEISLQGEFLKLSSRSRQIFSHYPDHFIHQSEPELVVQAIRDLVGENI